MSSLRSRIREFQAAVSSENRRFLYGSTATTPGKIVREGRELVNFASNDYLGLAFHPALISRAAQWTEEYGTGAGAARLITGNHAAYRNLEERLAELKGTEAALIFQSGFQANATVLAALLSTKLHGTSTRSRETSSVKVFSDRLNHASIHFGIAAAGVPQIRYQHNDLNHLEERLREHQDNGTAALIVSESIFSMDGDQVDVDGLRELAANYDAFLYVDEAHATGVAGQGGRGLFAARTSVEQPAELLLGTFSKALGSFGAYVACEEQTRDFLIQTCPGFIYSTGLPPAVLGAIDAALELVPTMDDERQHLRNLSDQLRQSLHGLGYETLNSTSQIIPVVIGEADQTLQIAQELEERGLLVGAIRPPTVPAGSSRLRISLSAAHSPQDVERLVSALQEAPSA